MVSTDRRKRIDAMVDFFSQEPRSAVGSLILSLQLSTLNLFNEAVSMEGCSVRAPDYGMCYTTRVEHMKLSRQYYIA